MKEKKGTKHSKEPKKEVEGEEQKKIDEVAKQSEEEYSEESPVVSDDEDDEVIFSFIFHILAERMQNSSSFTHQWIWGVYFVYFRDTWLTDRSENR